jgi:hypothetical protein
VALLRDEAFLFGGFFGGYEPGRRTGITPLDGLRRQRSGDGRSGDGAIRQVPCAVHSRARGLNASVKGCRTKEYGLDTLARS